ncbi:MAG: hypothetical protein JSS32_04055, partial [Verrucomicrobia bacterium]|nr:hypothetical protein [Verrucomicrobiota bacterium]
MSHITPQNPSSSSTGGLPVNLNASSNDTTVSPNSTNTFFLIGLGGISVSGDTPTNSIIFSASGALGTATVPQGGTGRTTLTSHGVLIGEGVSNINVTAAGTNGQTLIGSTGADPLFSSITSAGGTLTFSTGPGLLNIEVTVPNNAGALSIANGGTNATTFGVGVSSVIYFDGNKLTNLNAGTSGQLLISQGAGVAPQFQTTGVGSLVNITDNSGTSVTASSFYILGNTAAGFPVYTQFTGNQLFINLNTVPVSYGGTGRSILTSHGVLIGEGSSSVNTTAVGTNGQVLIGSTNQDPVFSFISSTGGTLSFVYGAGLLNIDVVSPANPFTNVMSGGTGRTVLTSHGVILGEGTNPVNVTVAGTNGQVLIGSTNNDPAFASLASLSQTLTFVQGSNSLSIDLAAPVSLAYGGTNTTSFGSTVSSVLYFNGSKFASIPAGSVGQFLLSQGTGIAPQFQTAGIGSLINITDNFNTSVTASSFFILGNTAAGFPITTQFSGTKLFINLSTVLPAYGGTGRTTLTSHGVLLGEGSAAFNVTAAGTSGQVLIGSTNADPSFSLITSSAGTLTFVTGPGLLNIEVSVPSVSLPVSIANGGTNTTSFGTTTSSLLYYDGSKLNTICAGTAGQFLISQGIGQFPAFITSGSGTGITITDNANTSVSSSSFFILGNTSAGFPISTQFSGTKLFINLSTVSPIFGGTGRSVLTSHGVVLGEGSNAVNVTAAGTNGQILIGSTNADPVFSLLTSSGGTLSFIGGAGTLNVEVVQGLPVFTPVPSGGTARTVLTSHGVLLGEGSNPVNVTAAGTNGQLLIAATNADPAFATVTSVTGTMTFTTGANYLSIDLNLANPLPIASGGTNTTSFGTTVSSVVYFDGSKLNTVSAGNAGMLLVSQGVGVAPQFQLVGSGTGITLTDNVNTSISSSSFFILGNTSAGFPISTQLTGTKLFINLNTMPVNYGGTGRTILTNHGVVLGEGASNVNVTAAGTNGQVLVGATGSDPAFATLSSISNTLTFVLNANNLSIDLASPVRVPFGGTGATVLTAHGVLIGEGNSPVQTTAAGTNGQVLLGSTGADPAFATLSSISNTLTFVLNANNLSIDLASPVSIGYGGTNATSFGPTTSSLIYYNGNKLTNLAPGSAGQLLVSQGTGIAPQFQLVGVGSLINITDNFNTSVTASTFFILGNTATGFPLFTQFVGNKLFINLNPVNPVYGGTGRSVLTSHGVLIGEGSNQANVTAAGISGQVLIGSSTNDPVFSFITSSAGTLSFVYGAGQLNIEAALGSIPLPVSIANGGTNTTSFGTTTSSLLYFNGSKINSISAGTAGQFLKTFGYGFDPAFVTTGSGSGITLIDNANNSVTSSNFFILGNTSAGFPITTQISGTKVFINLSTVTTAFGGTGRTVLTAHGVLLGEGSNAVNVTAAGTNGQVLIGSSTNDPVFAFITSSSGTLSFSFGPGALNIEAVSAGGITNVPQGGTGRTVLTTYGVLLGEGSNAVNVTAAGTNGQLLIGSTNNDPAFASVSSISNTITFVASANNLSIDLVIPVRIASGGTNATSFGQTVSSVVYFDGSKLNAVSAGTAGQLLTSTGFGTAPAFQTVGSNAGVTFTDNSNTSVTAASFFILGNTAAGFPITTQFTGTKLFINLTTIPVTYGGTGQTVFTSHGVLLGEGSNQILTTSPGTNGQVLIGSSTGDPNFATISSITNTITFILNPNNLSIDLNGPVTVPFGGTFRTVLTSHGVLLGEGSNQVNVTAAGTNGQLLIGSTGADPAFATISSITNTITFILNANNLSIDLVVPVTVSYGGTSRTVLTSHGVLLGEGSNGVNVTAAGTNGQVLIGSNTTDPAFATISSITNTITFILNANNLSIDLAGAVPIAYGGTNTTSFGNTISSVVYFNGSKLTSIAAGQTGQFLVSQGFGAAPSFQTVSGPTASFINLQGTITVTPPSAILQVGTNFSIVGPTTNANIYDILANSNFTASPGNTYTNVYGMDISPTASTSGSGAIVNYFGIRSAGNLSLLGSGTATVNAYGLLVGGSMASDTGTSIGTAYGASIVPNLLMTGTGTVGTAFGAYVKLTSTAASGAATANAYGVFIDATTVQNTTNAYGLYVATPTGAGTNLSAYFTTAPQFGTALNVASGGTGRTVFTSHGVLIGEGSNPVNVITGTNGQVLIGSNTADPAFATITSVSRTLTFVLGQNSLSIDIAAPVPIAFGGTNNTSFGTTISSALYFDGNKFNSITAGTTGQVLASQGFGAAPVFQAAASVTASFINLQGTITVTPPTAILQVGTNFAIVGPTVTANLYDILANSNFTASPGNTYTNVYGIDVSPSALTSGSGAVVNYSGIRSAGTLSLTGTGTAT